MLCNPLVVNCIVHTQRAHHPYPLLAPPRLAIGSPMQPGLSSSQPSHAAQTASPIFAARNRSHGRVQAASQASLIDLEEDDFGEETDAVLAAAAQAEKMMEMLSASQRPAPAQFAQAEKRFKPSHGSSPPRARPASAQPQPAPQPAANAAAAFADNTPKPAAVARAASAPAATSRGVQQAADLARHASVPEMGHVCTGEEIAQKRQEALKRKQAAALKKKIEAKRLNAQMLKKRKAAERRLAQSRARSQAGQQSQDSQDRAGLPSSAVAGVVFSQGSSGQLQSQLSN